MPDKFKLSIGVMFTFGVMSKVSLFPVPNFEKSEQTWSSDTASSAIFGTLPEFLPKTDIKPDPLCLDPPPARPDCPGQTQSNHPL